MRSFWQSDTALKIFSIVCAIALWFYVIAAQNPEIEVKVKNIPVQIDSVSEEALYRATGLSVIKPTDALKTSLTVKGRRSVIGGVDNKNIKAMVDVSEIEKEGLSAFTVNFREIRPENGLVVMPFVEASKAMARGVGYAGEGDVLTASITGALMRGFPETAFVEIFCPDWKQDKLLISHMGEYNLALVKWVLYSLDFFVHFVPFTNQ